MDKLEQIPPVPRLKKTTKEEKIGRIIESRNRYEAQQASKAETKTFYSKMAGNEKVTTKECIHEDALKEHLLEHGGDKNDPENEFKIKEAKDAEERKHRRYY